MGGLIALLLARLGPLDPIAIHGALRELGPAHWGLALCAVAVSFAAVGGQERVLHRHLGTGIAPARAFWAGMAAGAVSQTAGFGPLTGALVRWRMLPGLTLWQATRLSTALTVAFLSSLALLASAVLVALPATGYAPLGWAILTVGATLVTLSVLRPHWLPGRRHWPNAITIATFLFWAALDLAALGLSLWALFPGPDAPGFATLFPVVLLALGAGLASGAPAGVGAFEMVLVLFLPSIPTETLLAAVLGWRAVFYALPALLGIAATALAPRAATAQPLPTTPHAVHRAPRAETGLIHQGTLTLQRIGAQTCLTGRTPHLLVTLHEPFPGRPDPASLTALRRLARSENRLPALYKCDARLAATARRHGLRALAIAREAVIDPSRFDLARPAFATLRRKLRRAEAQGLTLTRGHDPACPSLAVLNRDWARRHGGERGFSMGRFCPAYLRGQRLYTAHAHGTPVAFVSFHATAQEWTLDLMRHGPDLPDGTMQALVTMAIRDAAAQGVPRLSLAAVPDLPAPLARLLPGQPGLAQFKQAFAPRWERRYLCAPGFAALTLAAAELSHAIRRPAPAQPQVDPSPSPLHDDDAEYEFATAPASWHRRAKS